MNWLMDCKYAPINENSKHCRKENEGKQRLANDGTPITVKSHKGARRACKGLFRCAKRCKFYEVR